MPQNVFRNAETPKELQAKLEAKLHLNEPITLCLRCVFMHLNRVQIL